MINFIENTSGLQMIQSNGKKLVRKKKCIYCMEIHGADGARRLGAAVWAQDVCALAHERAKTLEQGSQKSNFYFIKKYFN